MGHPQKTSEYFRGGSNSDVPRYQKVKVMLIRVKNGAEGYQKQTQLG